MIGKPIRNAVLDDPQVLADARRAAWAIKRAKRAPGVRRLGSGHFSAVYELRKRPGLVLKVGGPGGYGYRLATGYDSDDDRDSDMGPDAWPLYVQHTATLNPLPRWAPLVYHVESMGGHLYFAIMERLQVADCRGLAEIYRNASLSSVDEGQVYNVRDDLHAANIMQRQERAFHNQYVITDPWVMMPGFRQL